MTWSDAARRAAAEMRRRRQAGEPWRRPTANAPITRVGKTTGRFPQYNLHVGGVDVGSVKRSFMKGGGDKYSRMTYDVWKIHGMGADSQASAERTLIERAVRFGQLRGRKIR